MYRFLRGTKSSCIGAIVLLLVWGCAGTGTVGSNQSNNTLPGDQNMPQEPMGAPKATVSLLKVDVLDDVVTTMVRIGASSPLHDYRLEKLGEDEFSLDLADITDRINLPVLPDSSEKVMLRYSESRSPGGIQILGTHHRPLENYILDSIGNELILTLYFKNDDSPVLPSPVKASWKSAHDRSDSPELKTMNVSATKGPAVLGDSTKTSANRCAPSATDNISLPGTETSSLTEPQPSTKMFQKQYTGKPISLDLLDADVRNVLRLLSDITGKNIVIEPDVAGKVTLKVEQVPWDQILDMVLAMNDLGKEQVGNVIRIAKKGKLKDEWAQKAEEIRAKQELQEVAKDVGEIGTVYFTVNYALPQDIAAKLSESKSERGKVSIDERTSLIIYSDYPSRVENARHLLARLDKPTPQVLIEARIVTLRTQASLDLGIDWSLSTEHTTVDPGLTQNYQINIPSAGPSSFGLELGQLIGKTFLQVNAAISALETSQDLKVIAAPKVLTLDNVEAEISQGTQIPYQNFSGADVNVTTTQFKDAVVELKVTPHITPDQKIRLKIQAKQDEPGTEYNGQASIDTRKITTELLVDDGNVIVIGGVMRDRVDTSTNATPGLNKIPLVGRLFKSDSSNTDKTELLIFISPKIVEPRKRVQGA